MTKEIVKSIKAYKAFDKGLICRGFQYEEGEIYSQYGGVSLCNTGFHACENPLNVLDFYDLTTSEFCEVELSNEIKSDETKSASSTIEIKAKLSFKGFIKAAIDFTWSKCETTNISSGYSSKLAASGYSSKLAASGYSSKLAASGKYSKLAASGNDSNLAASGNDSNLAASGKYSKLAASGNDSNLAASGYSSNLAASGKYSKLAASGKYSKLAASGYSSKLAASGNDSNLAASGNDSNLAASGYSSKLAASGYSSNLAASGNDSVAISVGANSKVKGIRGTLVALTYYVDGKPKKIVTGRIGWGGLKTDTWYGLDNCGKFMEQ